MGSKLLKWFLFFLLLAFIINIGTLVLIHEEPRRGIITFEMLKSHNFFQPTVLGEPYYKKPPLHNWLLALFSSLFGSVSETSLRLPSALAVILTSVVIYFFGRSFLSKEGALFGALIYPTSYLVLIGYGTKCEPDTLFTLLVSLSTFAWLYLFISGKELLGWFLGYLFLSFAFLTKGFPSLQFFFVFVLSYLFYTKNLKALFSHRHFVGALLGLSPIFFWALEVNFTVAFKTLFSEVISRAPGELPLLKSFLRFISYPFRFIGSFFPWSLFLLYFLYRRELKLFQEGLVRVFFLAFAVDFLIYWLFPGSRLRYLMPAFPLLSLVLGELLKERKVIHKRAVEIIKFSFQLVVPLGIVVALIATKSPSFTLKITLPFVLFLYGVYFFFIPRFNHTYLILLVSTLMVAFRAFYSSYFLPIAQFKYPPVRKVASSIVKDSSGYPLFTKTKYLQLCFYVEKGRGETLRFTPKPPLNSLFLSQRPESKVIKSYRLGKHRFFLCSYGTPLKERGELEKLSGGRSNRSSGK